MEQKKHSWTGELRVEVMGFEKDNHKKERKEYLMVLRAELKYLKNKYNLVKYCRTRK